MVKKRAMAFLSLLVMVIGLACGCSQPKATENGDGEKKWEGTTLKVWTCPFSNDSSELTDEEFYRTVLQDLMEETGAELEYEAVPWDTNDEKLMTAFSAGTGPDVAYMYMESIYNFQKVNAFADISSYFTQEEKDNYLYWDFGNFDGGQYLIPFVFGNPRILFCNMDLLDQAGWDAPPATWDEYLEAALDVQEKCGSDIYPIAWAWGHEYWESVIVNFWPWLLQAGGSLYDADKNPAYNTPEALKTAQFCYDLKFKYNLLPDATTSWSISDTQDMFRDGKLAMVMQASTFATMANESQLNWDWAMLEDETYGTFCACDCLGVLSTSECKELACEAIKAITSPSSMELFHKELSAFPNISKDEEYQDAEELKPLYDDYADYFHVNPPDAANVSAVATALYRNLQRMMMGEITPQQAMDDTMTYAQSLT